MTSGTIHYLVAIQPDGTVRTFQNTQGVKGTAPNPTNPLETINYTISDESKEYDTPTLQIKIEDYLKVIRQGDFGMLLLDDLYLHTVFYFDPTSGPSFTAEPVCR